MLGITIAHLLIPNEILAKSRLQSQGYSDDLSTLEKWGEVYFLTKLLIHYSDKLKYFSIT